MTYVITPACIDVQDNRASTSARWTGSVRTPGFSTTVTKLVSPFVTQRSRS